MRKHLIYLILALVVVSCSAQTRLNRIVRKNPSLLKTTTETIVVKDTVMFTTERTIKDSLFFFENDTVVVKENNLTIKYFYDTVTKLSYIQGECDTITVTEYIEKEVEVEKIVAEKRGFWDWLKIILLVGGLGFLIYIIVLNRKTTHEYFKNKKLP